MALFFYRAWAGQNQEGRGGVRWGAVGVRSRRRNTMVAVL